MNVPNADEDGRHVAITEARRSLSGYADRYVHVDVQLIKLLKVRGGWRQWRRVEAEEERGRGEYEHSEQ